MQYPTLSLDIFAGVNGHHIYIVRTKDHHHHRLPLFLFIDLRLQIYAEKLSGVNVTAGMWRNNYWSTLASWQIVISEKICAMGSKNCIQPLYEDNGLSPLLSKRCCFVEEKKKSFILCIVWCTENNKNVDRKIPLEMITHMLIMIIKTGQDNVLLLVMR